MTEYSIGPGNHYAPTFTPDGDALVCVLSRPDAPPDLFRVELDDGDVTRSPTRCRRSCARRLRLRRAGLVHQLGPPRRGPRHPRRAGRAQRGRRRHRARRPDLAPLQRMGPAAPGVRRRGSHRAAPQLPRQRRLRPPLAARQPLAHGRGRGARRGGRARVPRAARLRPARGSRSRVAAGAASTPWPPSRSSRTSGRPASPACPFFDFIDSQLDPSIREDLRWWDRENTGDIEKDRARLQYYSPINHLDDVEAPLLLLGGALDPRCPPRQISEVAEALRARGRDL